MCPELARRTLCHPKYPPTYNTILRKGLWAGDWYRFTCIKAKTNCEYPRSMSPRLLIPNRKSIHVSSDEHFSFKLNRKKLDRPEYIMIKMSKDNKAKLHETFLVVCMCTQILGLDSEFLSADKCQNLKEHCTWVQGIDCESLCKERGQDKTSF